MKSNRVIWVNSLGTIVNCIRTTFGVRASGGSEGLLGLLVNHRRVGGRSLSWRWRT